MIASAAECDVSTVSLALRNDPRISEAKRLRIQEIAQEMGYQPDHRVSRLMNHLRRGHYPSYFTTVALLVGYENPNQWKDMGSLKQLVQGFNDCADSLGVRVDVIWAADPELSPKRLNQILRQRGIKGLIVTRLPDNYPWEEFPWQEYCTLRQSEAVFVPGMRTFRQNHILESLLSVKRIHELGYERPALFLSASHPRFMKERWRMGYVHQTLSLYGKSGPIHEMTQEDTEATEQFLDEHQPDVMLGSTAGLLLNNTLLAYRTIHPTGRAALARTPEETYIAGVEESLRSLGSWSLTYLVDLIQHNRIGFPQNPETTIFDGTWRDAPSLPPKDKLWQ